MPLQLDEGLQIYALGQHIGSDQSPRFHSPTQLFPVGYCSVRVHQSFVYPQQLAQYKCEVLSVDNNDSPVFQVTCEHAADFPILAKDPTGCWKIIADQIRKATNAPLIQRVRVVDGFERFGFTHSAVTALLQELPGVEKCKRYRFKATRVQRLVLPQK